MKNPMAFAVKTFVLGHAISKSLTHPYEAVSIDGVWGLRDKERSNPRKYRKEEWVGWDIEPSKLVRIATENTRGWHFLGAMIPNSEDPDAVRDAYKELGYRLLSTEPLFVHDLKRIPNKSSPAKISRMKSLEQSLAYAKEARIKPLPNSVLQSDSTWRHYLATLDEQIVGWVSSIQTSTGATWCANFFVREAYRRQGIGSALLAQMLRDDRRQGVSHSILLSSHTGAHVYPKLGYQQIGTLLILAPKKRA